MNRVAHADPVSVLNRTVSLIRAERRSLGVTIVYSVAIGLLSLVLPVAIQSLVNTVAFGSVLQPMVVLTIVVAVALTASAVLTVLRVIVLELMQRRIFVRHASDTFDTLMRFRAGVIDEQQAPELVNRFLDVTTVQKSATVLVVDGLTVLMQTLTALVLLAAYHPYLLLFDIVLTLAIVFVLFALGRNAVRTSIDESCAKYDVVAWLEEVARHSFVLRSASGARLAVERTNSLVDQWLKDRAQHFRILLRQVIGTQVLQVLAMSSLLGLGGYFVITGELTLGQLVAAELVVGVAVGSFAKFAKSLESFYDLQAAMDKLEHVIGLPLERCSGEPAVHRAGPASIKIHDAAFGYEFSQPVVRNISLDVPAGSKIIIHGPGAAGKSTLLDLVFGLREPERGHIELDGVDLRHLSLESLRQNTMLVRATEILPGTVFSNVAMGTDVSADEVRVALGSAGILESVNALPRGLQTELTAAGRPLAPSQALRLTIARAILHKPRLLLIDEALDSIEDLRADGPLVRALFAADAPWTLIVATERPELWTLSDQVYTIQEGTLQPILVQTPTC